MLLANPPKPGPSDCQCLEGKVFFIVGGERQFVSERTRGQMKYVCFIFHSWVLLFLFCSVRYFAHIICVYAFNWGRFFFMFPLPHTYIHLRLLTRVDPTFIHFPHTHTHARARAPRLCAKKTFCSSIQSLIQQFRF
jgi:hypothetical protein